MGDARTGLTGILLPRNWALSSLAGIFAIALVGLSYVLLGFIWVSVEVLELGTIASWLVYALCSIAVLGALLNGYLNDDLLVSICIAVAPLVGFGLFVGSIWILPSFDPLFDIGSTALRFGGVTVGIGVLTGFVGVRAGRTLRDHET